MQKVVKALVPTLILAFLLRSVIISFPEVKSYFTNFSKWNLLLSFAFMLFIYPEGAFTWNNILKSFKLKVKFNQTFPIWIISNTSRYIPGTIWQYLGRVEMSYKRLKIERKKTAFSLLYEVLMALSAAAFCASFSFLYIREELSWVTFLVIALSVLFMNKKVVNYLLSIMSKLRKVNYTYEVQGVGNIFLLNILNFLLNGVALYLLIQAFDKSLDINFLLVCVAFYAASWAIGFVSIFAPGGIGVVEVSLAALLSLFMPFTAASAIALIYRFLLTLAEGVIFLTVLLYERRQNILGGKR